MGLSSGGCLQSHLPLLLAPTNPKPAKRRTEERVSTHLSPPLPPTTIQPRKRKGFGEGLPGDSDPDASLLLRGLIAYEVGAGNSQGRGGLGAPAAQHRQGGEGRMMSWDPEAQGSSPNMLDLGRCLTCYMGSCHSLGCLSSLPCAAASYFKGFFPLLETSWLLMASQIKSTHFP